MQSWYAGKHTAPAALADCPTSQRPLPTPAHPQMVRNKLSEFVIETARFITSTADVSPELQQLRYCLCSVARQCGQQLGQALPAAFPDKVRGW